MYTLYNNFLDRSSGRYRFEQKMFLPIYVLIIDFDGQLILRFVRSTIQNRYKISTSNIATFFFFFFFIFLFFYLAERLTRLLLIQEHLIVVCA